MLAAAVDPIEGLFVEQADQTVLGGHVFHGLHGQLVVVSGNVGGGEDGGQLMLGGGHLVVFGFGQNAQLPQLFVQVFHKGGHPGLDSAKVVVLQLLALGGLGAEQGAAGKAQVRALVIQCLVHQEVLLLRAHGGDDPLGLLVPKQPQNAQGLDIQVLHRAQQGGLLVQNLAAVRTEGGGNVEGVPLHKGVRGGVPGGVAPSLEGGAQAAGGERGGVGLAFNQLFSGELHNHPPVRGGGDEAVVLFRGDAV